MSESATAGGSRRRSRTPAGSSSSWPGTPPWGSCCAGGRATGAASACGTPTPTASSTGSGWPGASTSAARIWRPTGRSSSASSGRRAGYGRLTRRPRTPGSPSAGHRTSRRWPCGSSGAPTGWGASSPAGAPPRSGTPGDAKDAPRPPARSVFIGGGAWPPSRGTLPPWLSLARELPDPGPSHSPGDQLILPPGERPPRLPQPLAARRLGAQRTSGRGGTRAGVLGTAAARWGVDAPPGRDRLGRPGLRRPLHGAVRRLPRAARRPSSSQTPRGRTGTGGGAWSSPGGGGCSRDNPPARCARSPTSTARRRSPLPLRRGRTPGRDAAWSSRLAPYGGSAPAGALSRPR